MALYNEFDTTLATVSLSTSDTDYMVWETFGASDMSLQLAWSGSGVVSTTFEVTNRYDAVSNASAGWEEVSAVVINGPDGTANGSWRRLEGTIAKKARVKLVHNSGGVTSCAGYVVRQNPRFRR